VLEARRVGVQRRVAVDARREVAEVRRRQLRAREPLEVEDIDRLLGRSDERVGVLSECADRAEERRCRQRERLSHEFASGNRHRTTP
jgi:hypothetical protein